MRGSLGSWSPGNGRDSRRLWPMAPGRIARELGKRCLPISQSQFTWTIDVGLGKSLTRVQGFPALDRGRSVPDRPIM